MKPASGCKLFGAGQALGGILDGVVLYHSVVGCNFGTMTLHVCRDMRDIRQTCTVISDRDVVFSGEDSLQQAVGAALELFAPKVLFVVSGCVSEMIGDDVRGVLRQTAGDTPVIYVEAAGFRGDAASGRNAGFSALLPYMKKNGAVRSRPRIQLIGPCGDDPLIREDVKALRMLVEPQAEMGAVLSCCTWEQVCSAGDADLNLVLRGRGTELARAMEERFGIPWEEIDYPYGRSGAEEVWTILERRFGLDYSQARQRLEAETAEGAGRAYRYLQALYGVPAAIEADRAHALGLKRFLEQELGMWVVCCGIREEIEDQDNFEEKLRQSEAALLFASSMERSAAQELGVPLIGVDYPVIDRVHLTDWPYVGAEGTLHILEDILNAILAGRNKKGALYQ